MRIFVTGGTGFIGRPLCAELNGHELLVLTREPPKGDEFRNCQFLRGDLFDLTTWQAKLLAFQPEVSLHLAWSDLPDYSLATSARNFQAGIDLFECLQRANCVRVVVTGTEQEYGNLTGRVAEAQCPSTLGLFAAFKTAQRLVGESLFSASSTAFVWARTFCVYGPGQRPKSLIPITFRKLRAGAIPEIRTPDVIRDYIHVEDVASGLAALATTKAPAGVYNLASGEPRRIRDIVNLTARLMGAKDVLPPTREPGNGYWANTERIRRETGWAPQMSLEEGVRRTLAAWKERE